MADAHTFSLLLVLVLFVGSGFSKLVMTPLGLRPSECVHIIENDAHIIDEKGNARVVYPNNEIQYIPPCKTTVPPEIQANGWQSFSSYNNENNATFTSFLGQFNVPNDPIKWSLDDGAILYMFTGLQSDNWVPVPNEPNAPPGFDIIQPVLQYGGDSAGGGEKYWAVASWYVTLDNSYVVSKLVRVKPGQNIFGNMTQVGPQTWFIGSKVIETNVETNIQVTRERLASQPWAYNTLEIYNVDSCHWLPPTSSPIVFSDLVLTDKSGTVTPQWNIFTGDNPCNTTCIVNSPSKVTITF